MIAPASGPREPLEQRLLLVDVRAGSWRHGRIADLARWLSPGDLLVVNDAATLPASLAATGPGGEPMEVRLAGELADGLWRAVLFGPGDWRTRTEHRPEPARVEPGAELRVAPDLTATVVGVDARAPRLVVVRFSTSGAALWGAIYRHGRPVQYAHLSGPLALSHVQTPFASRPWAVEAPSAGRCVTWQLVATLRQRGVRLAALTHAAGLSSTGDAALDAALPLPERYDLPEATVRAVARARAEGRRVVAVGTTVARALEGCAAAHRGELVAGAGTTDLRIGPGLRLLIADGVLTGLHEAGSSHRELLQAFAPEPLLARAFGDAGARGYLGHEFGDACLVLAAGACAVESRSKGVSSSP
ncbi:MAG TPA: S-adenosylmethionine:tRNA ribosyltransferase-isomerase [Polyangiaceae bacterium]|nr:S-adenosylmethionine:tRNA ribosyltransferase-isomerase [Polyangiaceae bacterium]